jgi:hypothetical protein
MSRTIEHAHNRTRSQAASVMATAPRVWVNAVNRNREEMGLDPIEVRGRPNNEGSESQRAANHHMLLQEKIRLLLEEVDQLGRN